MGPQIHAKIATKIAWTVRVDWRQNVQDVIVMQFWQMESVLVTSDGEETHGAEYNVVQNARIVMDHRIQIVLVVRQMPLWQIQMSAFAASDGLETQVHANNAIINA